MCSSGVFGVGASTVHSCGFIAVVNTPPLITNSDTYDYNGTPIIIQLTGDDADNDYVKFQITSRPTNGQITNHNSLTEYLTRDSPTSATLRYDTLSTSTIGIDSFTYVITDGREGHTTNGTININVNSLSDAQYPFYESFEYGLGNWIVIDDDDGDTHDYDYWQTGISSETSGIDGDYAYIRDCDSGCTLTMLDSIDITDLSNPYLSFVRYVDNIRFSEGDYYTIELYNGNNWVVLESWDRDSSNSREWYTETYDITNYSNPDFKIRLSTIGNGNTDYAGIDNVIIYDLGSPNSITDLSGITTSSSVTLSWSIPFDNGSDIIDYQIQRQTGTGSFVTIQNNYGDNTTTSYVDNTVSDNTEYTYRVRVQNAEGYSPDYSNLLTITTQLGQRTPIIEDINDITITAGTLNSFPVHVSDLNGDTITFTVSGADFVGITKISNAQAILFINPILDDVGIYNIQVTATDNTSLSDVENVIVTVTANITSIDDIAPVVVAPTNKTFEAVGILTTLSPIQIGTATATDNIDSNPVITNNVPTTFPLGDTIIIWTATDNSNNSSTDTQIITIQDTIPPVFSTISNIESTDRIVNFDLPTATDTVDDDVVVTCDYTSGSEFVIGTTTVTCTGTDDSDNYDTVSFDITVQEPVDPVDPVPLTIIAPVDITFEAAGILTTLTSADYGVATAADDTDSTPTITNDAPATFPLGDTIITWTGTDSSGNSDTVTQRITIRDTTPPDITAPANVSFTTTDTSIVLTSADYGTATATDRVDSSPTITNNAPPSFQADRTTTITWTATDDYGNSATSTSSVTVTLVTPTPLAPLNLAATSNVYGGFVTLSWDIPADDSVTGHRILRGLSPTSLSVLTSDTGSTITTYTDASASPNTTYHYQVMSLNAFGASPASGTISVTTPVARLASPGSFTVSFDTTDSEIDFRWDAVDGAETYVVQRYNDDYTFVNIIHTSAVSYSLPYSGTLPYSALYMVSAVSESERSIWSDPVLLEVAEPFAAVRDGFDSLGTWNLTTTTSSAPGYSNYTMSVDSQAGNPASALKVSGNGFLTFNTVTNTFDLAGLSRGDGLRLSVDMRITASGTPYPTLLPEIKLFMDSHARPVASQHLDYAINSTDGGWRTYTLDVPDNLLHTPGSLIVVFRTVDLTSDDRTTTVYFDNFRLDPVAP